ncbi:hypothetical protein THIOSC13_1770032 [uncultured Thiomicrorhabdus sp.]
MIAHIFGDNFNVFQAATGKSASLNMELDKTILSAPNALADSIDLGNSLHTIALHTLKKGTLPFFS